MAHLAKATDSFTNMCGKLRESQSFTQPERQSEDIPSHPLTLSSSSPDQRRSVSMGSKRRPRLFRGKDNLAKFLSDESSYSTEYSLAFPMAIRHESDGEQTILHHFHHVRHHDTYGGEPETRLNILRFYVRMFIEHISFRVCTIFLIFMDIIIVLFSIVHGKDREIFDIVNILLVTYFMFEVFAVTFGIGWKYYKLSWVNVFDCFIVSFSFAFIVILVYVSVVGHNVFVDKILEFGRLARVLRLLRVFRLYLENRAIAKALRKYVSRNKRRYQKDGFDLDLCYITERVIAMSIPSTGFMACYRNPVREVARFFETKYLGHYKIYNLCSEKTYCESHFNGPVQRIFIDDHNVPKFEDIIKFANDVTRWMEADVQNVIAVHCKGGKGRTGMMICVWLVHSREFTEAQRSLSYFGHRRTDKRFGLQFQGVQTPSQSRYVGYFDLVRNTFAGRMPKAKRLLISRMNIVRVSGVGRGNGTDLICRVNVEGEKFDINFGTSFNCKTAFDPVRRSLIVKVFNSPVLINDVKVMFFCSSRVPSGYDNCAFYCWFHTSFIDDNRLWLPREELDNPHKSRTWRTYREGFGVDFYFNEFQGKREPAAPPNAPRLE